MTRWRVSFGHLNWWVPCGPRLILGPVGSISLWFLRIMKNVTSIDIFIYTEWHLSLDMKTKVVQQVESEWMREWESVREWECETLREWDSVRVREWLLSIDMKTKVVQYDESEWMRDCESERAREWESERVRSGSQLLSDIQTFFIVTVQWPLVVVGCIIRQRRRVLRMTLTTVTGRQHLYQHELEKYVQMWYYRNGTTRTAPDFI